MAGNDQSAPFWVTPVSRRHLLRTSAAGGVLLATGGLLGACGSSESGSTQTTSTPAAGGTSRPGGDGSVPPGTYGSIGLQLSWIKNNEFVGEYMADSKGHYTAGGFKSVDLLAGGTSTTAESLLLANKVTVGLSSPPITAATVVNSQAPLKIIAAQYQKNPFAIGSIANMTPIRTAKDMIGKKIGVQAGGNLVIFQGLLKANKLTNKDVEIVGVEFDDSVLKNGKVDGFMTYVTDDLALKVAGYEPVIMAFADNGLPFVAETYTVLQSTLDKQRDMLKALLVAEIKGWADAINDPLTAATLAVTTYGKDQKLNLSQEYGDAVEIAARLMVSRDTNSNGLFTMTDELIASNIKSLNTMGYPLKASDLFDMSLIKEVYQQHPELKVSLTPTTDVTVPKAGATAPSSPTSR